MQDFSSNGRMINKISVCNVSCLFLSNEERKSNEKRLIYTLTFGTSWNEHHILTKTITLSADFTSYWLNHFPCTIDGLLSKSSFWDKLSTTLQCLLHIQCNYIGFSVGIQLLTVAHLLLCTISQPFLYPVHQCKGTGLRGGVHVKLPNLSKHEKFGEILKKLRLQKRGTGTRYKYSMQPAARCTLIAKQCYWMLIVHSKFKKDSNTNRL